MPCGQCCIRSCSSHFPLLQSHRFIGGFFYSKLRPWRRIRNLPCGQCCSSHEAKPKFCSESLSPAPKRPTQSRWAFYFSLFTSHSRNSAHGGGTVPCAQTKSNGYGECLRQAFVADDQWSPLQVVQLLFVSRQAFVCITLNDYSYATRDRNCETALGWFDCDNGKI